jgi:predicted nucleic acid-binding Zn ribbon protein
LKQDKDPLSENSRLNQRVKRKKANVILNSLIIVVLLLIVIVSINIFGKDDKSIAESNGEQTVSNNVEKDSKTKGETGNTNRDQKESAVNDDSSDESQNEQDEKIDEEELVESEDESDMDENESIENPDWDSVGTSQTEPAQDYVKGSVDWNEQMRAISSATGFDQGKDTLLQIGNNGPKKSTATVLIKETNQKFRVNIEWIDGEGWKPALVEEVK